MYNLSVPFQSGVLIYAVCAIMTRWAEDGKKSSGFLRASSVNEVTNTSMTIHLMAFMSNVRVAVLSQTMATVHCLWSTRRVKPKCGQCLRSSHLPVTAQDLSFEPDGRLVFASSQTLMTALNGA